MEEMTGLTPHACSSDTGAGVGLQPAVGVEDMLAALRVAGVSAARDDDARDGTGIELLGFEYVRHRRLWRPTAKKFWKITLALDHVLDVVAMGTMP